MAKGDTAKSQNALRNNGYQPIERGYRPQSHAKPTDYTPPVGGTSVQRPPAASEGTAASGPENGSNSSSGNT